RGGCHAVAKPAAPVPIRRLQQVQRQLEQLRRLRAPGGGQQHALHIDLATVLAIVSDLEGAAMVWSAKVTSLLLLLCAPRALAQAPNGAKIDPAWLRADSVNHSAELRLVAGLTDRNGGMNFNGFSRGGLLLTVPKGWSVVLHFKNQDQNLPHSVEVIADTDPVPAGPVPQAFEH